MSISLQKNQTVSLAKEAPSLTTLHIGLGWDPIKKKGGFLGGLLGGGGADSIDLDASVIVADGNKRIIDEVWFRKLSSNDGSIKHSGDNLTGEGDGDDEYIRVDLTRLSKDAAHIVVTVNSFRGQTFNEVDNAFCRLVDEKTGKEICRYELREKGSNTGFVMAAISRDGNGWSVKALGAPTNGRTVKDLAAPALNLI
ncbi:TerD family protein [Rhizobium leguminosarum]|uniref:TerD family protein n=1 Tax=Rhizobium leguminosarum TaxID=384 RepID=A0A6P0DJR7_RHILE|nr:TerD family protein [Rhizobium leguminosarum]NEK52202.1 TerD family protein [Rhizobium leguminosarum]WFT86863.1 TerD family protein [Rhizobium leguminosarum]